MDDETFRLVLRTFESTFQDVSIWYSMVADVILIGTDGTTSFDFTALQERILNPAISEDLKRILITKPTTLLSLQALTTGRVEAYLTEGPLNTEDCPRLEYWAPRTFYINRGVTELPKFDERLDIRGGSTLLEKYVDTHTLTDDELLEIGTLHSTGQRGYPPLGYAVLFDYCKNNPRDHTALDRLADVADLIGHDEESLQYRGALAGKKPERVEFLEKYAWQKFSRERKSANAFVRFDADESIRLLKKCTVLCADTVDRYRVRLGDIYFSTQEYKQAVAQYARALQIRESHEPDPRISQDALLVQFARSLYHLGIRDRAAGYALQATWINPNNQDARDLIYSIWTTKSHPAGDTLQRSTNKETHVNNRQ
jgi:tetratricopeptide (TPR) repeat protein